MGPPGALFNNLLALGYQVRAGIVASHDQQSREIKRDAYFKAAKPITEQMLHLVEIPFRKPEVPVTPFRVPEAQELLSIHFAASADAVAALMVAGRVYLRHHAAETSQPSRTLVGFLAYGDAITEYVLLARRDLGFGTDEERRLRVLWEQHFDAIKSTTRALGLIP